MKKLWASLGLAFGTWLCAAPAASVPLVVRLDPALTTVAQSTAFMVDVKVSGLAPGQIITAFDLNVLFDSLILTGVGAAENALVFSMPTFGPASVGIGNLGLEGLDFGTDAAIAPLQTAAEFVIASFSFMSNATDGFSLLTFGSSTPFESNIVGGDPYDTLSASFIGACVAVGTGQCRVPEPASYSLVGMALAGMLVPGALRRRKPKSLD